MRLLFLILIFLFNYIKLSSPVVHPRQLQRLNAGHATKLKIPIEEKIEYLRSHPHITAALVRSLGATALKQRAGRNLIFRVLLTIGYQNDLIECTARVMCEETCTGEVKKLAANDLDSYPTDPEFVTYVLGAVEHGREFGARYECISCAQHYPLCDNAKTQAHVLKKYHFLLDVTNYVLDKLPA